MSEADARAAGSPDKGSNLTSGQLVKRRLFGTEALYRVVDRNKRGVEVEVVRVDGLRKGSRFTFSVADVLSMDPVDPSELDLGSSNSPANPG